MDSAQRMKWCTKVSKFFGRETMFHLKTLRFQHQSFKSFTVQVSVHQASFIVSEQN